tara:strand:- start:1336 stop:1515 length:180 start_codon:yes stop_codon:yes gene_type:complete
MNPVVAKSVCVADLLKELQTRSPRLYLLEVARIERLVAAAKEEEKAVGALLPSSLQAQA